MDTENKTRTGTSTGEMLQSFTEREERLLNRAQLLGLALPNTFREWQTWYNDSANYLQAFRNWLDDKVKLAGPHVSKALTFMEKAPEHGLVAIRHGDSYVFYGKHAAAAAEVLQLTMALQYGVPTVSFSEVFMHQRVTELLKAGYSLELVSVGG